MELMIRSFSFPSHIDALSKIPLQEPGLPYSEPQSIRHCGNSVPKGSSASPSVTDNWFAFATLMAAIESNHCSRESRPFCGGTLLPAEMTDMVSALVWPCVFFTSASWMWKFEAHINREWQFKIAGMLRSRYIHNLGWSIPFSPRGAGRGHAAISFVENDLCARVRSKHYTLLSTSCRHRSMSQAADGRHCSGPKSTSSSRSIHVLDTRHTSNYFTLGSVDGGVSASPSALPEILRHATRPRRQVCFPRVLCKLCVPCRLRFIDTMGSQINGNIRLRLVSPETRHQKLLTHIYCMYSTFSVHLTFLFTLQR
jgi:hypothetical protein